MKLRVFILLLASLISCNVAEAKLSKARLQVVETIIKAADKVQVPRELLLAICWTESSYRATLKPRIDGDTESHGICQVKLETAEYMDEVYGHRHKVTRDKLQSPYLNAFYAAKYLRYQLNRYNWDWKKAIDAYNKGHHVSSESEYVQKVLIAVNTKGVEHAKTKPTIGSLASPNQLR